MAIALGSTLKLTFDDLYRHVLRFFGGGRSSSSLESDEETDVQDIVLSGLRSFYGPVIEGQRYVWSFLKREGTLTTVADTDLYTLPSDFGGLCVWFSHARGGKLPVITRVSYDELLALVGNEDLSGTPQYAATYHDDAYKVRLYPRPDKVYTLTYRYAVVPQTDEATYPPGADLHSEVILEACLSAAELVLRPEAGPGIHSQRYATLLSAAVAIDRGL